MTNCGSQFFFLIIKQTSRRYNQTDSFGDLIVTHRGGEMSGGLDVEQLLVDDLEVLSTPLAGTRHRVMN